MSSSSVSIDEVTALCVSQDDETPSIICCTLVGSRLIIHNLAGGKMSSSLTLHLPNDTLDRVVSARLMQTSNKLLILHVLTYGGILIVLDLTRFLPSSGHQWFNQSQSSTLFSTMDPLLRDAKMKGELNADQTVLLATNAEDLRIMTEEQEGCMPLCMTAKSTFYVGCSFGNLLLQETLPSGHTNKQEVLNAKWKLVRVANHDINNVYVSAEREFVCLQTDQGLYFYCMAQPHGEVIGETISSSSDDKDHAKTRLNTDGITNNATISDDKVEKDVEEAEGEEVENAIWRECESESDEEEDEEENLTTKRSRAHGIFVDLWPLQFLQTGVKGKGKKANQMQRRLEVEEAAMGSVYHVLTQWAIGGNAKDGLRDGCIPFFVPSSNPSVTLRLLAHGSSDEKGGVRIFNQMETKSIIEQHSGVIMAVDRMEGVLFFYSQPTPFDVIPPRDHTISTKSTAHNTGMSVGTAALPPSPLPLYPCAALDLHWLLHLEDQYYGTTRVMERIEQVVLSGESLVVATNIFSHPQFHTDNGTNRSTWNNRHPDINYTGNSTTNKTNLVDTNEVLESKIYICQVGNKGLRLVRCLSLGRNKSNNNNNNNNNNNRIVKLTSILREDDNSNAVMVATESSVFVIPTATTTVKHHTNEAAIVRALVNVQKQRYEACLSRLHHHNNIDGGGKGGKRIGDEGGGGVVLSRLSLDDQLSLFFASRSSLLHFQRELLAIIPRLTHVQCCTTLRHICTHLSQLDTTTTTIDTQHSSYAYASVLLMLCKMVLIRMVACFESIDNDIHHIGQPRLLSSFPMLFTLPGSNHYALSTDANTNTMSDSKGSDSEGSEKAANNFLVLAIQKLLSICEKETSSSIDQRAEMDSAPRIVAMKRALTGTIHALFLVVSDSALQKTAATSSQHRKSGDHHQSDDSTTNDGDILPEQQPALLPQLLLQLLGRIGDLCSPSAAAIFISSFPQYYASKRGKDHEIMTQNQNLSWTYTSLMLLFLEVTYERAKSLKEMEYEEILWTAAVHVTTTDDINQAAFLLGNLLMLWRRKGLTAAAFEKRVLIMWQATLRHGEIDKEDVERRVTSKRDGKDSEMGRTMGPALIRWYLQWAKRPPTTCICHTKDDDYETQKKMSICGMCELPFVVNAIVPPRPLPSWLLQHTQQHSLVFTGKFMIRLLSMTKLGKQ